MQGGGSAVLREHIPSHHRTKTGGCPSHGATTDPPENQKIPALNENQFIHQPSINIDEGGTEASSATDAQLNLAIASPEFKVDHPFLVLLYHKVAKIILGMGRIINPLWSQNTHPESFWNFVPSPNRISGTHSEWPLGSWSTLLLRTVDNCSVWLDDQLFEESWLGQTSSIWELWRTLCSWEPSVQQIFFLPFPRSVPRNNPVSEVCRQFLWPHCFCSDTVCIVCCNISGFFY